MPEMLKGTPFEPLIPVFESIEQKLDQIYSLGERTRTEANSMLTTINEGVQENTSLLTRFVDSHALLTSEISQLRVSSEKHLSTLIAVLTNHIPEGHIPISTFKDTVIMLVKVFGLIILGTVGLLKVLPAFLN